MFDGVLEEDVRFDNIPTFLMLVSQPREQLGKRSEGTGQEEMP